MSEISCLKYEKKKGVYRNIANNTFSYALTLNEFRNAIPEEIRPSWVKLTTITMVSKFQREIDIASVKRKLQLASIKDSIYIKRDVENNKTDWKWCLKDTSFYNQITLNFIDDYSTKSIKVFPNGSIQVAGASDLFNCRKIISQISYLFDVFVGKNVFAPIESFKIVMINSNFSLNYKINLRKTCDYFSQFPGIFKVSFEPDKYSAVKIKFQPANDMKEITTSIFSTGKIIITGAETLKEVAFAYNIINDTLNNIENVRVEPCDENKKELFDDFSGYKMDKFVSLLKSKGFKSWKFTTKNRQINF
jgi:TATA-box binding protein (TBP) (component of TFIID and TFIIIB)